MKKNRIYNNFGLKLLSLVAAMVLWVVVMNIEDPIGVRTFSNISITIKNDDVISQKDKIYQIANNQYTISVTVEAKRSVLRKISVDDIEAVADFKDISLEKLVPIKVSIPKYESECESITATPTNLEIEIEDEQTIKLPITVSCQGSPEDGHFISYAAAEPDTISITGGKSVLGKIDKAVVQVNVSGVTTNLKSTGKLYLYDADGKIVDQSGLKTDIDTDNVTCIINVSANKSLPIKADYKGMPKEGYHVTDVICTPEKIDLSGNLETLNSMGEILIDEDDIDITDATESMEITVNIQDYLPQGVSLAGDMDEKVLVTINIEPDEKEDLIEKETKENGE